MPHLIISYGPTGSKQNQLKDTYLSYLKNKGISIDLSNLLVIDVDRYIRLDKRYSEKCIEVLCQFFEECAVSRDSPDSVSVYLDNLLDTWNSDDGGKCSAHELAKKLEQVYLHTLQENEFDILVKLQEATSKNQNILLSLIGKQTNSLPLVSMSLLSYITSGPYPYTVSVFLDTVQHIDQVKESFKRNVLKCYTCLKRCYKNLQSRKFEDAIGCIKTLDDFIPPRLPTKGEVESIQNKIAKGMPIFNNCVLVNTTSDDPVLIDVTDVRLRDFVQGLSLSAELKAALFKDKKRSRSDSADAPPVTKKTRLSEPEAQQKFIVSAQKHLLDNKIDKVQAVAWLQKGDCDIFIIGERHADHTEEECDGTQQAIDKVISDCPDLDLIIEAVPYEVEDERVKYKLYASPNNQLQLAYSHYANCMKQKNCSFRVHWADPTTTKRKKMPSWLDSFRSTMSINDRSDTPFRSKTGALFDETDIQHLFTDNTLLQHEISKTIESGNPINELFTRERLLQTFMQINNLLSDPKVRKSISEQLVSLFSTVLPSSEENKFLFTAMDQIVADFQNWSAANKEDKSANMQKSYKQPGYVVDLIYKQWEQLSREQKLRKQSIKEQLMEKFAMFDDLFPHIDLLLQSFPDWTSANEDSKRNQLKELVEKNGYSGTPSFLNRKIDLMYQTWKTDSLVLSLQKKDRFFGLNRTIMDFYTAARVTKLKMKRVIYYAGSAHLEWFLLIMVNSGFAVKKFQKGKCNPTSRNLLPFYTDKGDHFEINAEFNLQ